jgi:uncharacterized protein YfaS (alpha-2-macroglobulin family)
MFKKFIPILLATILSANTLNTSPKVVPLERTFSVDSNNSSFDVGVSYTHKNLLTCNPAIDAVYRVVTSKKLKVIPKESLKSATEYSCNYKKNSFSFTTEPLTIKEYHYFKRDRVLRLNFNAKLNLKSVKSHIKLEKKDKLSSTNLNYTIKQQSDRVLLLHINEPIGDYAVELKVDKTLLSEKFSATFNDNKVTPVVLNKDKEPMVISDKPQMVALDNGEFAMRIFLDDTLEGKIKNFIDIEGIENFRFDKDNYINYQLREDSNLSGGVYYYTDIISSEFKPNSIYRVTLKKGLKNYRELKVDKKYTLKTENRAKSIIFEDDKPYISNAGEIGFKSINVDSATLIVERILDDNLRYFLNFSSAKKDDIYKYTKEIFSKNLTLNNQKNIISKQKFLLSDIAKKLPYGVYKITLRYTKGKKEKSSSKILFLSNLGVSVNISKKQAFVTVLTLNSAKPVLSAEVELYGANNELLGKTRTDVNGVAIIKVDNLLTKKPKGVIVKTENNQNFLALNHTISSPTPDDILEKHERFKAHIYFQSKLVRPEERVNALLTIKDRDFISASKLPIKITLKEQYGKVLKEKIYHTDEYGLIDFNHQLDSEDKTGNYELIASIGETQIGKKVLKVEAFMPPKIENHISIIKEGYKVGEPIEVNITSNYLFGTPASKLNGKVTLDSRLANFEDDKYKNYSFTNINISKKNTQTYLKDSQDIRLDDKGKTTVVLPTDIQKRVPSILELMIGVTVMDDTQPVSSYKRLTLYPYEEMVGVRLDKNQIEKGGKIEGTAILINPINKKLIDRELYAVIKKVDWHYSYSDGHYEWDKEIQIIDSFNLKSNQKFSKTMDENGEYIVEVYDRLGGHSSSSSFEVWWESYSNISPKDNLKSIEISFEDKLYKKGDVIDVTLKSPVLKGELFLTLEGNQVKTYKRVSINRGVAKIKMPINHDMVRGAYLHATAYRPSDSSSALIPFRAIGYKFVKANRDSHKIDINITIPKEIKSKSILKMGIKTDKKSKVLISVVDSGIVQLAKQKKPKIFDYFNEKPKRALSYYDLYDQLMTYVTEGKLIDFGAGDIAGITAFDNKHKAPDLGKRIKPFMKWSGVIDNQNSQLNASLDIPEFNGKATIIILAINEDSIGVISKEIIIKDDIMIKPSYPMYALVGDKIEVPIRLFNTTKKEENITLTTKISDNLSLDIGIKDITIPANSSKLIIAKLRAKEIGRGEIIMEASFGNEKVSNTLELPIYSPYAISTKTFKGISTKAQSFRVPKEYKSAKVYITISDNLIGSMRDDLKFLIGYPYGCAEQTTSKISAMHYAKPFLKNDKLLGESKNFIRQGIKKLRNLQNYYGEFSYWEEDGYINPYASLYSAQTLLELKKDGVDIDKQVIDKSIAMLKAVSIENKNYMGKYSEFHRIYSAYILAKNGSLDSSTTNMLLEKAFYKKHFLSTLYMSAILKIEKRDSEADKLYKSVGYTLGSYQQKNYGNFSGNFESNSRDMLLHFIIKSQYFNRDSKDLSTIQHSLDELYSTQEKAIALKAISLYLGKPKSSKLDVNLKINSESMNFTQSENIAFESITSDTISLNQNSGAMSYNIELVKQIPKALKNQLSSNKKLSIMREFINDKNQTLNLSYLKQGDKIYSKVTIANMGKVNSVVVNQRIPACLTIVNNNIQSTINSFRDININQEYRDIRDDRVLNFISLSQKTKYNRVTQSQHIVLNKGVIFTPLIVTTKGECQVPAVITEAMYDSRINDYAKETNLLTVGMKEPEKTIESKARELVKLFYSKEMSSNSADEFINLFSYPIETYYRTKNATKEDIVKDKQKYFGEWTKRVYSNIKLSTISVDHNKKEVKIKIIFDYILNSDVKELKGVSQHLLTIKKIKGKLLITKVELPQ